MRSESVDLWNTIEEVSAKGHNLRITGPRGTGKSSEARAPWKAKNNKKDSGLLSISKATEE